MSEGKRQRKPSKSPYLKSAFLKSHRSKYKNTWVKLRKEPNGFWIRAADDDDGAISFQSKAEAGRFIELAIEEKSGAIRNFKRQVRYPLFVEGVNLGTYIVDFDYERLDGGKWVHIVEDVKGVRTDIYVMKAKTFQALYPHIKFIEVPARKVRMRV